MATNIQKLVFVVFTVIIFLAGETGANDKETKMSSEKAKIIVSYFYTTYRCPSCEKIEKWSYEAIKDSFPEALKDGRLIWRAVNVDKPENKHFIKDYNLFTKSLIISELKGEKEMKWENMDKVWQLLRDQENFFSYVTLGVKKYLEK